MVLNPAISIKSEELLHDKIDGALIYMKVLPSFGKNISTHEREVHGSHFKCREIMDIRMILGKLVCNGPQGCFRAAARADHIRIRAKGGPQMNG